MVVHVHRDTINPSQGSAGAQILLSNTDLRNGRNRTPNLKAELCFVGRLRVGHVLLSTALFLQGAGKR